MLLILPHLVRYQPLQDEYRPDTRFNILEVFLSVRIDNQQSEHVEQAQEPDRQQAKAGIRYFHVFRLYGFRQRLFGIGDMKFRFHIPDNALPDSQ